MLDIYDERTWDKPWKMQIYYWKSDIQDMLFSYNRVKWSN